MKNLIYRQNKYFVINKELLPIAANNEDTINSLYTALYFEFRGANENIKYANLTYLQRIEEVNKFANNWLKQRGFK